MVFSSHNIGDAQHTAVHNQIASRLNYGTLLTDYSPVGDDWYPAFMSAFAAGKTVYMPTGRYRISKPIVLPGLANLCGDGPRNSIIVPPEGVD